MNCVNLILSLHFSQTHRTRLRSTCFAAMLYTALVISLLLLPRSRTSENLLHSWSSANFFSEIREDLRDTDADIQLDELKNNFLFNERIKDPQLVDVFQTAGLSHLLAISGGQTGPAATFLITMAGVFILLLFKAFSSPPKFDHIHHSRYLMLGFGLICVFFLIGLYQSTGALVRVFALQLTTLAAFILRDAGQFAQSKFASFIPVFQEALPWFIALLIAKNPTDDLSFLLSALGSSTAEIISSCINKLTANAQPNTQKNLVHKAERLLTHLGAWVLTTSLTSALMCFFCLSMWPATEISEKIMANLLAGPVVLILITPATLTVILSQVLCLEQVKIQAAHVLNHGLRVLREIAETFGQNEPQQQFVRSTRFVRPGVEYEWFNHPYLLLISLNVVLMLIIFELKKARTRELLNNR